MAPLEATASQYPYDHSFQLSLLALAYREPKFSTDYIFLLEPIYFDSQEFRHLARILLDYIHRYGRPPEPTIYHDIVRSYALSKQMADAECHNLENVLDRALTYELTDIEWIREEAVLFAKGQMMKAAILNAYHNLSKPSDYVAVVNEFQKILEIDTPASHTLRFADIIQQIPQYFRSDSSISTQSRIPTGLPALDDHMFGGAARGKLGTVMARSGGGKTHLLTYLGSQAIRRGYPVYHFAFGDMNQWEVSLRYAANFTRIDSYDIYKGIKSDFHVAALNWLQQGNKDLFVTAYPPDTITPGNLKSTISSMISRTGVKPAMVIVDYADNLATGDRHTTSTSERNSQMGVIYQQLIKIAVQFDCVVWTGSQVQRSFYRLSSQSSGENQGSRWVPGLIDTDAIAEAIKKIDAAEYILSINQSREDDLVGIARIFEAKIRFGKDKHVIDVRFDKGTSMFTEREVHNVEEEAAAARAGLPTGHLQLERLPIDSPLDPDRARIASIMETPLSARPS
jgi:replicative DNA helicase